MPKSAFFELHPLVTFFYFAVIIIFAMAFMHPVCLCIALLSAAVCLVRLRGAKAAARSAWFLLPMMLLTAIMNPLFSHVGVTVLTHFPNGSALTLESTIYGAAAAVMLAAVILWFLCLNEVITADKTVYLFGRIIPSLALIFTMALRFVPRFTAQMKKVSAARKGLFGENRGFIGRISDASRMLSAMVTWSLENAVDTADSMKNRGYGLPGRTAYSIYRFSSRDTAVLIWLAICTGAVLCGAVSGAYSWQYFPSISVFEAGVGKAVFFAAYALLCVTPHIIDTKEAMRWRALKYEN